MPQYTCADCLRVVVHDDSVYTVLCELHAGPRVQATENPRSTCCNSTQSQALFPSLIAKMNSQARQ